MEDKARINEGLRARYSMLDAQYGLGEVTTLEEAFTSTSRQGST